jgi:hypothetical protein
MIHGLLRGSLGDPTKAGGVVVLRIKFPVNSHIPPHTHPYDEVVTLISGTIGTSGGEKLEKKGEMLKAGSLWVYPAQHALMLGPETRSRSSKYSSPAREALITPTRLTIRGRSRTPNFP